MARDSQIIEEELLKELPIFEQFFLKVGMKRIDGAIYGLLSLSTRPLTSEEIEKTLNLSQSAISTSLSNLANFGAIESFPGKERRLLRHTAKTDTLKTVANIFRIRELEAIDTFKKMAQRVQKNPTLQENDERRERLKSIVNTSELAESVIELVIETTKLNHLEHYDNIIESLPKGIKLLKNTSGILESGDQLIQNMSTKFEKSLKKLLDHGAKR